MDTNKRPYRVVSEYQMIDWKVVRKPKWEIGTDCIPHYKGLRWNEVALFEIQEMLKAYLMQIA